MSNERLYMDDNADFVERLTRDVVRRYFFNLLPIRGVKSGLEKFF